MFNTDAVTAKMKEREAHAAANERPEPPPGIAGEEDARQMRSGNNPVSIPHKPHSTRSRTESCDIPGRYAAARPPSLITGGVQSTLTRNSPSSPHPRPIQHTDILGGYFRPRISSGNSVPSPGEGAGGKLSVRREPIILRGAYTPRRLPTDPYTGVNPPSDRNLPNRDRKKSAELLRRSPYELRSQ